MPATWPFSAVTAPTIDTGFMAMPTAPTTPPGCGVDMDLHLVDFSNPTDQEQFVTVTNAAGLAIVPSMRVAPRGKLSGVDVTGLIVSGGLLWYATSAAVVGKVQGWS